MTDNYQWVNCRNDRCFKEVFFKEKNKHILKAILEYILKVKIKEITIEKNEKERGNINIKGMRTDLSLDTDKGYINVEVNSTPEYYVHPRNFSYIADKYSHDTLVGQKYSEEIMYVQINLSYGLIYNKAIREYKLRDNEGKEFIKNFTIYEINMDYYLNLWYTKSEIKEEKILIMLGLDQESLKELSKKDKIVREYMEEVNEVNENPKFREYISYEEDQKKIQNSLLYEAEQKGINSRNKEIAENLLRNEVEIEKIINTTGLSKEEVLKMSKELNIEPKYREYISYEEDQKKIQNSLLEEAEQKGINSRNKEIAKDMLKDNINIDIISKYTKLSIEEIEKLK